MGYITKSATVSMKARVTALGSKALLTDPARFNITQFALYDDEVDYSLWNENHDNGTDGFGNRIESLPLLEPGSSAYLQCRYPLLTGVDPGTIRRPVIHFNPESPVKLKYADDKVKTKIELMNADGGRMRMTIFDSTYVTVNIPGSVEKDVSGTVHKGFSKESLYIQPKVYEFDSTSEITWMARRQPLDQIITTKVEVVHIPSSARASIQVNIHNNTNFSS